MSKITIEQIRKELSLDDWKINSVEYINLTSELEFECPEGHKVFTSWGKLRNKLYCPVCASNKYKDQDTKVIRKAKGVIRCLALDQATYKTGWAIYDDKQVVKYGIFETKVKDEIERDNSIKHWLISMLNNWKPDHLGLEDIQLQKFQKNADGNGEDTGVVVYKTLAHLQGILMDTAFEQKQQYHIISPSTWRSHCGVKGRSRVDKKRSMQLKIKDWFDISVTDDAADALGIGKYMSETVGKKVIIENWE